MHACDELSRRRRVGEGVGEGGRSAMEGGGGGGRDEVGAAVAAGEAFGDDLGG